MTYGLLKAASRDKKLRTGPEISPILGNCRQKIRHAN